MKQGIKIFVLFYLLTLWAVSVSWAEEAKAFAYEDKGRRDPFWKLVNKRGIIINYEKDLLISDMTLEGIMLEGDGSSIAIINGKIVSVSDAIGVFVVEKIDASSVVLKKGQDQYILKLQKKGE